MRCIACNKLLSDFEATRKNESTLEYIDLCNRCFSDVKSLIPVIERDDLDKELYIEDEEDPFNSEDSSGEE